MELLSGEALLDRTTNSGFVNYDTGRQIYCYTLQKKIKTKRIDCLILHVYSRLIKYFIVI